MKKMNKKGFTIVELSIAIAVIAILSAVLIPTFSGIVKKAKDSAALQEAKNTYTEYLTGENFNYAEEDKATLNMVFEASNGKFVIVKAGEVQETIYETEAKAKTALGCVEDTDTETEGNQSNYTSEEKGGFDVYTFAE